MKTEHAILAIWHDIEPEHEAEVLGWYDEEHHPERLQVPGISRGCRYVAMEGSPKFFIFYEADDVSIFESRAYLSRVDNPTPRTQSSMVYFRNNIRIVCRSYGEVPKSDAVRVATIRFAPEAGMESRLRDYVLSNLFADIHEGWPGTSIQLLESDENLSNIQTREKVIRGAPDRSAGWAIVLGRSDRDALDALLSATLFSSSLIRAGSQPALEMATYVLQTSFT